LPGLVVPGRARPAFLSWTTRRWLSSNRISSSWVTWPAAVILSRCAASSFLTTSSLPTIGWSSIVIVAVAGSTANRRVTVGSGTGGGGAGGASIATAATAASIGTITVLS